MDTLLDILSSACLLLGGCLCITGGVGLLRFPDFFTRVHAAGVTETLAAPLLVLGIILNQPEFSLDSLKLIAIVLLILATNPTASHAMTKAALHGGHLPLGQNKENDLTLSPQKPPSLKQSRSGTNTEKGGDSSIS